MTDNTLEERLRESLIREFGYVMGSAGLRRALGFSSQAALRAAIAQGRMPVKVFVVEGRRGPFALAHDVAAWLATVGEPTLPISPARGTPRKTNAQEITR